MNLLNNRDSQVILNKIVCVYYNSLILMQCSYPIKIQLKDID